MRMVFPHHVSGRFINEIASDMNALVESIFGEESKKPTASFVPTMDIEETEKVFELSLDLPGVNPDDIEIEVENDHVSIRGTRIAKEVNEDVKRKRVERSFGEFHRQFQLPEEVDQEAIVAGYEHGVLTIRLPKTEKKGAKKIVISQHSEAGDSHEDEAAAK